MSYQKKIVNLIASKNVTFNSKGLLDKILVVSLGESNIPKDTHKEVSKETLSTINAQGDLKKVLDTFFKYAPDKTVTVLDMAAVAGTPEQIDEKVTRFKKILDGKTLESYLYLMPKEFFAEDTFSSVVSEYNDINKIGYFVMPVAYGTDTDTDDDILRYNNMKSVILVYEQLADVQCSAIGAFAGVYLSRFMISEQNKMKSMTYQFIMDNVNPLSQTDLNKLEKKNIVYFGSLIGKPNIMNAVCMDGESFDFYIGYDNLNVIITTRLTGALVISQNRVNAAYQYNDSGILSIKQIIESCLNTGKLYNILTEYGKGYNDADAKITDKDEIAYVPFVEYRKNNAENYNKGIYTGYSFNALIGRFILDISITSNIF